MYGHCTPLRRNCSGNDVTRPHIAITRRAGIDGYRCFLPVPILDDDRFNGGLFYLSAQNSHTGCLAGIYARIGQARILSGASISISALP